MPTVLSQLLLADVSHRSFITKQELDDNVMQLPTEKRSFANVDVVGFYHRSTLKVAYNDGTIVYYDRTEYSAYAERCGESTVIINRTNARSENVLTKEMLSSVCFRKFAETINHEWVNDARAVPEYIGQATARKFISRDVNCGHWVLKRRMKRRYIRFSTVLYMDAPHLYEPAELGDSITQTSFFGLPIEKRTQLYRAYTELVCYIP